MTKGHRFALLLVGLSALPLDAIGQQHAESRDGLVAILISARQVLPQGIIAVGAREEFNSMAQSVAPDLNAVVKERHEVMLCEERSCVFAGVVGMIDVQRLAMTDDLVEVYFTRMRQYVNESHAWIGFEEIEASARRKGSIWVIEKFRVKRQS